MMDDLAAGLFIIIALVALIPLAPFIGTVAERICDYFADYD